METVLLYRWLAAGVVLAAGTVSTVYRERARRVGGAVSRAAEGLPIAIFLRVFGGLAWLALFAFILKPEWVAWASVEVPEAVRWAGAVLALVSVPLMWWVFRSLGLNVTDTVATREGATLVTHGPYRWVRHPLYSVGFLLFAGLTVLAANAFQAIMAVLALGFLVLRTRAEEANLLTRFGTDYATYQAQTGRFVPRLAGGSKPD
jgi:protein-S-isoprenylcysteine O-methyltransferase Ste14